MFSSIIIKLIILSLKNQLFLGIPGLIKTVYKWVKLTIINIEIEAISKKKFIFSYIYLIRRKKIPLLKEMISNE